MQGGPDFREVRLSDPNGILNVRNGPLRGAQTIGRLPDTAILRNLGCRMNEGRRRCQVEATAPGGITGRVAGDWLVESGGEGVATQIPDRIPGPDAGTDALVPGTPHNATGPLSCVRSADAPMQECTFGVIRESPDSGNGSVTIDWPDGGGRMILFEAGAPVSFDRSQADQGLAMTVTRTENGINIVFIGEERFEIPDAVIWGGRGPGRRGADRPACRTRQRRPVPRPSGQCRRSGPTVIDAERVPWRHPVAPGNGLGVMGVLIRAFGVVATIAATLSVAAGLPVTASLFIADRAPQSPTFLWIHLVVSGIFLVLGLLLAGIGVQVIGAALYVFGGLYLVALVLYLVGTFGLFGSAQGPLAGVFPVPLGLPWTLLIDRRFPEPLWPRMAALTPSLNLGLIWSVCRVLRGAGDGGGHESPNRQATRQRVAGPVPFHDGRDPTGGAGGYQPSLWRLACTAQSRGHRANHPRGAAPPGAMDAGTAGQAGGRGGNRNARRGCHRRCGATPASL